VARLAFYGGVGEIGGTKILLEDGDLRLLLDFGLSYGRLKLFYEEYLRPRLGAGLLDYLEMGVLPPVEGIYRRDLEVPDLWPRFRDRPGYARQDRVDAILLTHAHFDHSAHVSFLDPEIPVYATTRTALLCKAIQESGKPDLEQEVCWFAPRSMGRPKGWKQEALRAERGVRRVSRQFNLGDADPSSVPDGVRRYWTRGFWPEAQGLAGSSRPLGAGSAPPLPLRCFPVDHSIHGACAWAVETRAGWIVYTGDLRMHGARGAETRAFAEEAARLRPRALIMEATNALAARRVSEAEVRERATTAIGGASGLVIVDFSARDMERLALFHEVARETGRRLVVLPKDAYLLKTLRLVIPSLPDPATDDSLWIYHETTAAPSRLLQSLCEEYGGKLLLADDVAKRQDELVLCFSFFDLNELPSIRPRAGSLYLYSSSEPHDEEQMIDFRRLHAWLQHFSMRSVGLPIETDGRWTIPEGERGLHASGHAWPDDLLAVARTIAPEILIPVHTEHPEFYVDGMRGTSVEVRLPELFGSIEV